MSQREAAKAENRTKIKDAARAIIREEGMDKLTMRRLAEVANVSLRTPYNLFGSKTEVLFALLANASDNLSEQLVNDNQGLVIERLFYALDAMEAYIRADNEFYQTVYWGVMTSDQGEKRRAGYDQMITLTQAFVTQAIANNELASDTDPRELGKHIGIQLMSVLGMWASGFFDSQECVAYVRKSWSATLLIIATRKSKAFLSRVATD